MKKTLTVNLGGSVYNIDEDAYRLLDKYLSNLRYHFKKEEGAEEIVNDIELRISELFAERLNNGYQVITIEEVENVISRVGRPEELLDEDDYTANDTTSEYQTHDAPRKLYRDPDNKVFGGVISGMALYMKWDVTPFRLIFFLCFLFSRGTFAVLYLLCWLFIPLANTAAEKLAMRGKKVTLENIGKTVTTGFDQMSDGIKNYVNSDKPRSALQRFGDLVVQIIGILLKVLLVILAIVFSPILFVFAICFIALIFVVVAFAVGGGAALYNVLPSTDWAWLSSASPILAVLFSIAGILAVGIPLISIVYAVFGQLLNWKPMKTGWKWTLLVLWIISLVAGIAMYAYMGVAWPTTFPSPLNMSL